MSGHSHDRARAHEQTRVAAAVDHWLAGLCFALILSVTVAAGASRAPFFGPLFQWIENQGIDASMRVRTELSPFAAIGNETASRPGYFFIDVDPATCHAAGGDRLCDDRSPMSPEAAAKVATAVLAAEPRVVIIDAYLWSGGPQQAVYLSRLAKAAAAHPKTRVIAVAPTRLADKTGTSVMVDWSIVPQEIQDGALRFAPAFVESGGDDGDIARRYRATFAVTHGAAAPSLPYLAALYAAAGRDAKKLSAIDCLALRPAGKSCLRGQPAEDERLIVFTMPVPPAARQTAQNQYLFSAGKSSRVLDKSGALKNPELFSDGMIAIGTSEPNAGDRHNTPLGEMTGAEIVLNAARTFAAGVDLRKPSLFDDIRHEFLIAAVASLPFFGYWLFVQWVLGWAPRSRWSEVIGRAALVVGFLITIALASLCAILFSIITLGGTTSEGLTADFYTPLVALSLESFAHGAKFLLDGLHAAISRTRRALWNAIQLLRRQPAPQKKEGRA